jgi:fumarate reductase flavoprotein subunit
MKKMETEIVVIAAGPAGLSAAVEAAENGADVIVLEKASTVGGAANMGMGPLGIGTKYQKQQMIDITVEKAFNMFMEYTHYNVDARLVKRYFEQSAETIEWLEGMGVEFEGAFRYFPKSEATWHIVKTDQGIGPRAASFLNKALYNRARELGVEFLLETPAKKIIMKEGKVAGVLATNKDGEEIEISCKAAIICTGGAGANKELIKEETGFEHGKDLFSFAIPGLLGDGMKMAWEVGAAKTQVRIEMAACIEGMDNLPQSIPNVLMQPNLLVNKHGKRIMNEEEMQNATYLSNVVAHQKDKVCFSIVDSSIVKYYIRNGVDNVSLVRTNPDVSDFYDGVKMAEKNQDSGLISVGNFKPMTDEAIQKMKDLIAADQAV